MKSIITLIFSFFIFINYLTLNPTFAHNIPDKLIEFLLFNPDPTAEQVQAFITKNPDLAGMIPFGYGEEGNTYDENGNLSQLKTNPKTNNLVNNSTSRTKLLNYLKNNPAAMEQDILDFMSQNPDITSQDFEAIAPFLIDPQQLDQKTSLASKKTALNNQSSKIREFLVTASIFISLGIEHILSGFDHILFVISLILLWHGWRKILILISVFTVSHSITLILAGSELVELSPKIVEPIIAFSIFYTTLTSVFLSKISRFFREFKYKIIIVFIFGLFHGLGFAGLLQNFEIPQDKFISSLLFFNIGVEIGQFLILLISLSVLFFVWKSKNNEKIIKFFAILILFISSFWFLERIFN
jgi:hydrogenase/urease accessory protein HupE